ncbi:MAG: hypothetical protein AAF530_22905 [Pseudomonadota bacterium]
MSLGLRENRKRRQRQFWWRIAKFCFGIAIFLALAGYAYLAGKDLAQHEVQRQGEKIAEMEEALVAFQDRNKDLSGKLQKLVEVAEEWKARYERDIPTGELDRLLQMTRAKLEGGLDPDRLAFFIESARPPHNCDEEPVTKRFIVRTSLQGQGNDTVSFAQNAVTVTAQGEASVDANGNAEAWFDKAKPLTVTFTQLGGEQTVVEGELPLYSRLIVGANEYRFGVTEGPRGFVLVVAERCDYP